MDWASRFFRECMSSLRRSIRFPRPEGAGAPAVAGIGISIAQQQILFFCIAQQDENGEEQNVRHRTIPRYHYRYPPPTVGPSKYS